MAAQQGTPAPDFDAIIIGAGMSGLFLLHRLRGLGMKSTRLRGRHRRRRHLVLEPLSRRAFDSESYSYGYSFSKELLEEWDWTEHFLPSRRPCAT